MSQLEFADYKAGICGNDAKEEDAEETRDETKDSEGLREGENAQGDVLSEHKNAGVPPIISAMKIQWTVSLHAPLACLVVDFGAVFVAKSIVLGDWHNLAFRV